MGRLAIAIVLAGCGERGGDAATGLFETTATYESDTCEPTEPREGPPFFSLHRRYFIEMWVGYAVKGCESDDWLSCDQRFDHASGDDVFSLLDEEPSADGALDGEGIDAEASPDGCVIQRWVTRAIDGEGTVRFESRHYREIDPALVGDACEFGVASDRADTLPCVESFAIEGVYAGPAGVCRTADDGSGFETTCTITIRE